MTVQIDKMKRWFLELYWFSLKRKDKIESLLVIDNVIYRIGTVVDDIGENVEQLTIQEYMNIKKYETEPKQAS